MHACCTLSPSPKQWYHPCKRPIRWVGTKIFVEIVSVGKPEVAIRIDLSQNSQFMSDWLVNTFKASCHPHAILGSRSFCAGYCGDTRSSKARETRPVGAWLARSRVGSENQRNKPDCCVSVKIYGNLRV